MVYNILRDPLDTAEIPYTEIRIYEDGGNEFVYNENLSDEMNENLTEEVTADYVKMLLKGAQF